MEGEESLRRVFDLDIEFLSTKDAEERLELLNDRVNQNQNRIDGV